MSEDRTGEPGRVEDTDSNRATSGARNGPHLPGHPDVGAPLSEPYDGKPSEALRAGYCPSCRGTGRVDRVVPYDDVFPCSTCSGSGEAPP